jgi:uncharacterized protein YecE (DUF72 family)
MPEHEMQQPTFGKQITPSLRASRLLDRLPSGARKVWIGTSGWTYDGWRGPFYPAEIPKRLWLSYYATQFATTEINASFYRTPSLDAVRSWRDTTPAGFTFAWKASKFITHWKKLSEKCKNSIELMETRLEVLGPKGCLVLFQLPPHFLKDRARLDAFIQMLPGNRRYAFEFRHRSWYQDEILHLLEENKVALCISDHGDAPSPWEVTARHVYVRAHGPGGRYHGSYSGRTLAKWAELIAKWRRERREVYVYFDNDVKAAAPKDARRLLDLVQDRLPSPRHMARERT